MSLLAKLKNKIFPINETKIKAPNLVGLTLLEAVDICKQNKLTYKIVGMRVGYKPANCTVTSQSPLPGKSIVISAKKEDVMITLTIMNGVMK